MLQKEGTEIVCNSKKTDLKVEKFKLPKFPMLKEPTL